MPTTMRDIGRLCGLSASSVSRALRGDPRMSADTIARVKAVAESVGYRLNVTARELRLGQTDSIGFVFGTQENPYEVGCAIGWVQGIADVFESRGVGLDMVGDSARRRADGGLPRVLAEHHSRGVILAGKILDDVIGMLDRAGVPWVALDIPVPFSGASDCVTLDDEGMPALAIDHLCALGHRDIAYVNNETDPYHAVGRRVHGYLTAMADRGLQARPRCDVLAPTPDRIEELFASPPFPTALVTFDDETAAVAMREVKRRGLRVPGDVSVVGVNDEMFCDLLDPMLTTVRLPFLEMGRAAAEMMLEKLTTGGRVPSRTFSGDVVERESTALCGGVNSERYSLAGAR